MVSSRQPEGVKWNIGLINGRMEYCEKQEIQRAFWIPFNPTFHRSSIPAFPKGSDVSGEFWILTSGSLPHASLLRTTDD